MAGSGNASSCFVNILSVSSGLDGGTRLAIGPDGDVEHEQADTSPQQKDWEAQLMRDLGGGRVECVSSWATRGQVAKLADVSREPSAG
jgi:hypothetical protein